MSQQQPTNTGLLIAGIIVGMLLGGSVLALLLFAVFMVLLNGLGEKGQWFAFSFEYIVAILLGVGGILSLRRGVGFGSGLLVGLAAGLLGGAAMCNVLFGGLNNMH